MLRRDTKIVFSYEDNNIYKTYLIIIVLSDLTNVIMLRYSRKIAASTKSKYINISIFFYTNVIKL